MIRRAIVCTVLFIAAAGLAGAQGFEAEPVFQAELEADREPLVAGENVKFAVVIKIEHGWHINSNDPGDDFSVPTELEWRLPEGWQAPILSFPAGKALKFEFSDEPISVWEGDVAIVGNSVVPSDLAGSLELVVAVTAQACNDTQCLPPVTVLARKQVEIAVAGTSFKEVNSSLFKGLVADSASPVGGSDASLDSRLAGIGLPLQIALVFVIGLGLAFTPCVYPLIPITISFFSQQAADRAGGTFRLAFVYVMGIAITYSSLGVFAALTGRLFGALLQNPFVIGGIVVVLLALATSMFGLWEIRPPTWAMNMSGGRQGYFGSLMMGLVVGIVAAPCVGPAVVGLLTYVGERGDPWLGFALFFSLSLGLGLPYLILGTFTGAIQKMPSSGMWMVGVRRVFGVLLIALAAYFVRPMLSGDLGDWLIGLSLCIGGAYLLIVERTGNEQPAIDRVMRLLLAGMIVAGIFFMPLGGGGTASAGLAADHLAWEAFEKTAAETAIEAGGPVIVDFYADWCAPCRELDEKTFSDPRVSSILEGYSRFKVDLTGGNAEYNRLAQEYSVRGVPTIIVYNGGEEQFRLTGFEPPEQFLKRIE